MARRVDTDCLRNNANKAMIGLGMGTLLSMFSLAGINKRRFN